MTSQTSLDPRGVPIGTDSEAAIGHAETALWRMLSFYDAPVADLDAAIAADPWWPLPRLMKAGFLLSLTEPSTIAEARAILDVAESLAARSTHREALHLRALRALADGEWLAAEAVWNAILAEHPRDVLALLWAHLFDFHRGDAASLADRVARVLPAWHANDALYPYVLGMQAFGLEERGRYAEAEAIGRHALAGTARVPWAIHAVAHVMEMQGRFDEGGRWMEHWRADWADGNGFGAHLGWHQALFALERLDIAEALKLFDEHLHPQATAITLQRVDAASLLWRLHLLDVDVGDRWRRLLDGWDLAEESAGLFAFNDLHALLARIGAGDLAAARRWADRVAANASTRRGTNHAVARDLGGPLMDGMLAYAHGDFDGAVQRLEGLRRSAPRRGPTAVSDFGGSHAQRDLIDQTLIAAAAGGSDRDMARRLQAERVAAKPGTPLTEHWVRRLGAARAG